jgi:hypothetical protein
LTNVPAFANSNQNPEEEKRMKLDMKKAMAGLLNQGGSIFGELGEGTKKLEDLKNALDKPFKLGRFEVLGSTKKHNSPYVTFELNGELYSGYATALGKKLMRLCSEYGKVDGKHYYFDKDSELTVVFKLGQSPAGEYLDMFSPDEAEA